MQQKIAMNKALEEKLIGPMEESHTKQQSPKEVLRMELWTKRSKIAAKRARTRAWARWGFFWVEDEVCECWHKWRGATRGPRDKGARPTGGGSYLVGPLKLSWLALQALRIRFVPKITLPKVSFRLDSVWYSFSSKYWNRQKKQQYGLGLRLVG